jgi:hypothetical protein
MLAIPISILVLLAMIAIAMSPLLAVALVGVLFAGFLAYAWRGPAARSRGLAASTPADWVVESPPRLGRWIQARAGHPEGRLWRPSSPGSEAPYEGSARCAGRSRVSRSLR